MSRHERNRNNLIFGLLLAFGAAWLFIQSPIHRGFPHNSLFGLFSFTGVLHVVLAVWVGVDANRRRMNGVLWGLLVFFTSVVGLIVYLIVVQSPTVRNGARRTPDTHHQATAPPAPAGNGSHHCGSCGAQVRRDFRHCPYCGQSVADACPGCGQAVALDWQICPRCRQSLTAVSAQPADPADPAGGTGSTDPASGTDPTTGTSG